MLPKTTPPLNEEQWKAIEEEIKRKPTTDEVQRLKKIKETFKSIPL